MSPRALRLLVELAVAGVAGLVALGVGGGLVAPGLYEWTLVTSGVPEVHLTSPSDLFVAHGWVGVAFAMPVFSAWLASLVHHVVGRQPPPWWLPGAAFVLVALAVVIGLAYRVVLVRSVAALSVPGGITPILTLDGIDLGGAGFRAALFTTIPSAGAAALFGRRALGAAPPGG